MFPSPTVRRLFIILLTGIALATALAFGATRWTPATSSYPVQGITVSARHGDIDWPRAKAAGASFAYVRASMDAAGRDPRFAVNWEASRAAGVRRGAWHAYSLCRLAADQAANFITTVPREPGSLPPAIRLEFSDDCTDRPERAVLMGEIGKFIQLVEAHTEQPVVLSIDQDFEDSYQLSGAIDRPLWLRKALFPPDFGAHAWVMWQANPWTRIDGITGPVEWSVVRQ